MDKEARRAFEKEAVKQKRIARQQNLALAHGVYVNTSNGRTYYENGVGQKKEKDKRPSQEIVIVQFTSKKNYVKKN